MNDAIEEIQALMQRVETLYDQSRIRYDQQKEIHDNVRDAGGDADTVANLQKHMHEHLAVTTTITDKLRELQAKIEVSKKVSMPLKTIHLRETEPLYAYEAMDTDSNFLLTRRARQVLKGIVDFSGQTAVPNCTTLLFGPVGHTVELFGWEIVGLYNMLVQAPVGLARDHWTRAQNMIDTWGNSQDLFQQAISKTLQNILPNAEDRGASWKTKRDTFACPEWVDFRKSVYNPILGAKESKFHKRVRDVLENMCKKRKRMEKNDSNDAFVRLDLPCELSVPLSRDIDLWFTVSGYHKQFKKENKTKSGWGIHLGDVGVEDRKCLVNILKFYFKRNGECLLNESVLKKVRNDPQLKTLLEQKNNEILQFARIDTTDDVPICALLSLCNKGYFKESLK